jgi:hypothetical protein
MPNGWKHEHQIHRGEEIVEQQQQQHCLASYNTKLQTALTRDSTTAWAQASAAAQRGEPNKLFVCSRRTHPCLRDQLLLPPAGHALAISTRSLSAAAAATSRAAQQQQQQQAHALVAPPHRQQHCRPAPLRRSVTAAIASSAAATPSPCSPAILQNNMLWIVT